MPTTFDDEPEPDDESVDWLAKEVLDAEGESLLDAWMGELFGS